jgi:hypothetical protein
VSETRARGRETLAQTKLWNSQVAGIQLAVKRGGNRRRLCHGRFRHCEVTVLSVRPPRRAEPSEKRINRQPPGGVNFRVAEHSGVIARWLEPKCGVRPLLRIAGYTISKGHG